MIFNRVKDLTCIVIEQEYLTFIIGKRRVLLTKHLDHHIVGRLIYKGDKYLLSVELESAVLVFGGCGIGHFPYKVPCEHVWDRVSEPLNVCLIDVARFAGAHIRQCIQFTAYFALIEEFFYYLLF